ncbi:helix-turn-helix transcriptional regulator [Micromonospora sp. NPDC000207]|uniref:helix-turn-helix domain-containing protein n=1 Tax=Micromonospora sp. NPDC000207 TaxID=3154246 RepID=UPI003325864C
MGQTPRKLEPAASERHFFGFELRRLREQASLSQARLGALIRFSPDLVRRVETADRFPSLQFVQACDEALSADGALMRLLPLLETRRSLERSTPANPPTVVPVPLATSSLAAPNKTNQHSDLVKRVPFQPGVLDSAALDWLNASRSGDSPPSRFRAANRVTEDELAAAENTLTVFRQMDHTHGAGRIHAQVQQYIEGELNRLLAGVPASEPIDRHLKTLAAGFFELCGYQAVDTGAYGLAQRRYLRALRLAQTAGDRCYGGYLLAVNIGHLALHCNHPEVSLRMAIAALTGCESQATPATRAALHAVVARAHARLGHEADAVAHLTVAEKQLTRSRPEEEPSWLRYFTWAYLADELAHCFHDLGQAPQTQRHLDEALTSLSPSHVRRLAIDTALLASSLAAAGHLEEACVAARKAVDQAARTTSHRCLERIVDVQVDLDPFRGEPEVRELSDYIRHQLPLAAV